jgi:aminopeptidase N
MWIINSFDSGYYRVNYDLNNWNLLINQLNLNHSKFDAITRAKLIDDSFNLAKAGLIDLTVYLNLIKYLANEQHHLPIETALFSLSYIDKMISSNLTVYPFFKVFCKKLFENLYETKFSCCWNTTSLTDM